MFDNTKKYDVILCDAPWSYDDKCNAGKRGAFHKYPLLTNENLANLNVKSIASDNSILFFWCTWPKIFEAKEIIDAWGFTYKTKAFTWVKTNKVNKSSLFWGMGRWTRACDEFCLLCTRGKPKRFNAGVHSVVMESVGKHSEKPEEVRKRIELLTDPNANRIELFARIEVPGWSHIGSDLGDGDIRDILK